MNNKYLSATVRALGVLLLLLLVSGCSDSTVGKLVSGVQYDVVINEVMSTNSRYALSSDGSAYDWVELRNDSDQAIDLSGCFLSDDELTPRKWEFPVLEISAHGYAIVRLSGLSEAPEGELHTSFKLSSKGENLLLSDPQGNVIDQLTIPPAKENVSYGRDEQNASNSLVWFSSPTPGAFNSGLYAEDIGKLEYPKTSIVVNEYMSRNSYVLYDCDGDYSDWVELYNPTDKPVDISGFGLTDDLEATGKWIFPTGTVIPAEGYLVVFCSGKDMVTEGSELHTSFSLGGDDKVIALITYEGAVGSSLDIVELNENVSCGLTEDGAPKLFSKPTPGRANTTAYFELTSNVRAELGIGVYINEVLAVSSSEEKHKRDWIEIYNSTSEPVDLSGYGLSTNRAEREFTFPVLTLAPNQYLLVYCTGTEQAVAGKELHAGFKLNQGGETLYLFDKGDLIIDVFASGKQRLGVTSGRLNGELETRCFFNSPTPGKPNKASSAYPGYASEPLFSSDGGYVSAGTKVTLKAPEGHVIRYTTTGSEPTAESKLYTKPITIKKTTVIRAKAYKSGSLSSDTVTCTFLVEEKHSIAVVSLSSKPSGLFSERSGMLVDGPGYTEKLPHYGANYWKQWEREAHIEYFTVDGKKAAEFNVGLRNFGQYARGLPQKGLALILRECYGANEVTYPFFEDNPVTSFKSMLLRPSGQDWNRAKLRDELVPELIKGQMNIDAMDSTPVALYINGDYWGLYYLREKLNENYLVYKYGMTKGNIDLIKGQSMVRAGTKDAYRKLMNYVKKHDMGDAEAYAYVCSRVDIESLINFWIVQTFVANYDTGNIRMYRDRNNGKFKWMLYDFDWALMSGYVNSNLIEAHMLDPEGHGAVNNMDSTLTRKLLKENRTFRKLFISEYCKHLKTTFAYSRTSKILDSMSDEIKDEIPRQYKRWRSPSKALWKRQVAGIDKFLKNRPGAIKKQLKKTFKLSSSEFNKIYNAA